MLILKSENSVKKIPEPSKYITPQEAHDLILESGIERSIQTVYTWIEKYGLGKRIGGRWGVDREKLVKFIKEIMEEETE